MFSRQYRKILLFFQIYGILPGVENFSILVSIFWLSMSPVYVWWGVKIDMMSVGWIEKVYDVMYFVNYLLMFVAEIFVLLISMYNADRHRKLWKSLSKIDGKISNLRSIDYKSSRNFNATKIAFLIFCTISSMSAIIFYYIDSSSYVIEWLTTMIVSHMIHVKVLSFCFLVDLLCERLDFILKIMSESHPMTLQELIEIHSEIFNCSRLIHKSHGLLLTVIIAIYCSSSVNGIYSSFLKVSGLHPEYGYLDICYGTLSDGLMIFVICYSCTNLEKLNEHFVGKAHNLVSKRSSSNYFELFSIKSYLNKISMNGPGTLYIKNSLIVEIFAMVTPFLIFIIQFEIFFDEKDQQSIIEQSNQTVNMLQFEFT